MYAFSVHYKEYLVDKINKNRLDPITLYDLDKMGLILTREGMEIPIHFYEDCETEDEFKEKMIVVCATMINETTNNYKWLSL